MRKVHFSLHARLAGAASIRHSLRPLFLEGHGRSITRACRAAGMRTLVNARSESDEAIHVSASGEMDCFASLAMTRTHTSAFSRHIASESCFDHHPRKSEGAGNTGCWPHPRALRAKESAFCARKQRQGSRDNRRSLRNGLTAYTCSPRRAGLSSRRRLRTRHPQA